MLLFLFISLFQINLYACNYTFSCNYPESMEPPPPPDPTPRPGNPNPPPPPPSPSHNF